MKRFLPLLIVALGASAGAPLTAQTFNPGDHGNVTLHLRADTLGLANNSPVPAWGSLTAAGGAQPTYIASDARFNNQPVVTFDGTSDLLTWSSANLAARTVFAVVTLENGAVNLATLISNGADGLNIRRNNSTNFYRSPGQGMDGNDLVGNAPVGTLSVNNVPSGAYTGGAPHLVIAVAGAQKNYSTFWIGNANSSLGRWWRGSVAEVLIYDGALAPSDLNAVGYYFQTKYNLPTNFVSPGPIVQTFSATTASGVGSEGGVLSTAGAPVTLSWATQNSTTVSIDQGVLANSPNVNGSVVVSPNVTTTYTLTATNAASLTATRTVTVHIGVTPQPPRINEFLAENDDGLRDADNTTQDWIEIFNPNPYGIDLHGYRLRDSVIDWDFPVGSGIAANGYRVVFASAKNLTNPANALHTNFRLENGGEYLALIRVADNTAVTEFAPAYPPQFADSSYGYWGSPLQLGYFGTPTGAPTPGAANSAIGVLGFLDKTDDTDFSIDRGFYTSAVTTTISATTPGAKLIYTTNGSTPSETNGTQVLPTDANTPPSVTMTIHPGAVPGGATGVNIASIGGVTTLRVAAFKAGFAPTNIDTQTYLFPVQVLGQTAADATGKGWPVAPVNGQIFNYGMDPNVVNSFPQTEMIESLHWIPTLSIVTDFRNLVDSGTGIYVNADQHGAAWERPVSVELIHPPGYVDPDGNPDGFQIDAGLRIRGGFSRNDGFFKHGLRLFFSNKYDGKLKYRLFGNEGTDEFGKIDLGTSSNYAWYRESNFNNGRFNTMCRDPFARDTQGALGQPYTKSRYYHLYLNGHYWGIYYSEERAEAEFGASYMGGDADEYDAVKCANHIGNFATEATDGTLTTWRTLWDKTRAIRTTDASNAKYFEILGRNADGTRNPALPVLLDVDNLIDEMLVIFYMGDGDAVLSNFLGHDRPNNWFSVYRRTGEHGFRFFIRDGEHTLGAPAWVADQTGPWGGSFVNDFTYSNPQRIHQDLMASPEYRLRFADHVQRHFFNNGALTPAECIARFRARANRVEKGMKAESARWGDAQSISGLPAGHPPRYLFSDWQAAVDLVTNSIMPGRSATVRAQLLADGLYSTVAAATFLNDATGLPQHGGAVPAGFQLRISAPAGVIYYTLDGTDPRAASGLPVGQEYSGPLPINNSTPVTARVLSGGVWSALETAFFAVNTFPATAANLVVSQIDYNPAGGNAFEFLEFMNISGQNIDLTGVRLRDAVDYDFPDNTILAPGARLQVVGDLPSFATRHGAGAGLRPLGTFIGNLANGGEHLLVVSEAEGVIKDFSYDNQLPWPTEADGGGYRLVLIQPATNPNHAVAANWRGSAATGGAPGISDALPFTGNPAADADEDGLNAYIEYVLGTSDNDNLAGAGGLTSNVQSMIVGGIPNNYLTLSITRHPAADDALATVEFSDDLLTWNSGVNYVILVSRTRTASGLVSEVWRAKEPVAGNSRQFLRLRAQSR